MLIDGGAKMPVRVNIESNISGTLALGETHAEKITDMQSEGAAFTGNATGLIHSPDARRTEATTLKLKLMPHQGKLADRVLATSGDPNVKNAMLPYVLTLNRVSH